MTLSIGALSVSTRHRASRSILKNFWVASAQFFVDPNRRSQLVNSAAASLNARLRFAAAIALKAGLRISEICHLRIVSQSRHETANTICPLVSVRQAAVLSSCEACDTSFM
jgi:hypothetical protein